MPELQDKFGVFYSQYWGDDNFSMYMDFSGGSWTIYPNPVSPENNFWPSVAIGTENKVWGVYLFYSSWVNRNAVLYSADGGQSFVYNNYENAPSTISSISRIFPITKTRWLGIFRTASPYTIYSAISEDYGQTWGEMHLAIVFTSTYSNQFDCCMDPITGDIYIAGGRTGAGGDELQCVRSTDGGETWSSPVAYATGQTGTGYINMTARDGHVFIGKSHITGKGVYYSHDSGQTWSFVAVDNPNPDAGFNIYGIGICDSHVMIVGGGKDWWVYPSREPLYRFIATNWESGEPSFTLDTTWREYPEYEHYNEDPNYDYFVSITDIKVPQHLCDSDNKMFICSIQFQIDLMDGEEIIEITYEATVYSMGSGSNPERILFSDDEDADVYDLDAVAQLWYPPSGTVYTNAVAMPDYDGTQRGEPLSGDRGAWDVSTEARAAKHASDIAADEFKHHVPEGSEDNQIALWNSGEWDAVSRLHASTHENDGNDEIDVTGLSGLLADEQDSGWIKALPIATDEPMKGDALTFDGAEWTPQTFLSWKGYRENEVTFGTAEVWTDIPWDKTVDAECLPELGFLNAGGPAEDTSIVVVDRESILYISGHINAKWNSAGTSAADIASRVVYSHNDGTSWSEMRDTQLYSFLELGSGKIKTFSFSGTIAALPEMQMKLQVYVGDTNVSLDGWSGFDDPIAASICIHDIAGRMLSSTNVSGDGEGEGSGEAIIIYIGSAVGSGSGEVAANANGTIEGDASAEGSAIGTCTAQVMG